VTSLRVRQPIDADQLPAGLRPAEINVDGLVPRRLFGADGGDADLDERA